jgi:hypothetical protein
MVEPNGTLNGAKAALSLVEPSKQGRKFFRLARDQSGDTAPVPGHFITARLFSPLNCDPVSLPAITGNESLRLEVNSDSQSPGTLPI